MILFGLDEKKEISSEDYSYFSFRILFYHTFFVSSRQLIRIDAAHTLASFYSIVDILFCRSTKSIFSFLNE